MRTVDHSPSLCEGRQVSAARSKCRRVTSFPGAVPLSGHRARVEEYLRGIAFSFTSVAGRIIEERLPARYAGDLIRPSLVLWTCGAAGGDIADALPVAAAFELFDRFMLLHDELAQDCGATVTRWGLGQSLNAGDALYALAFRTLASEVCDAPRRLHVARLIAEAVLEAIEAPIGDAAADAALSGAAMQAGAILGGAGDRAARSFARAGRLLTQRMAQEAVSVISRYTTPEYLQAFDEVARYVAQRAA